MKNFNNIKMTMFDSTNASFRVAVEANFVKRNQTGMLNSLVFITNPNPVTRAPGNAHLNPSIYLTFSYKAATYEETKTLYTSYPQLFKIREAFEQIKNYFYKEDLFIDVEGVSNVNPKYNQPVIVDNLGKQKKWIAFNVITIDTTENGITDRIPGVSIQLSDSSYTSPLTKDEFFSVYTIVKDLNLSNLQAMFSMLYLQQQLGNSFRGNPMMMNYPQNTYQGGGYQGGFNQFNQGYQNPNRNSSTSQVPPKYNTSRFIGNRPEPNQPRNNIENKANPLPSRKEKPLINSSNLDEVEVSEISFDDTVEIENIFNEE